MSPSIHEDILEKNRRFWTQKYIFNKHFISQIHDIFQKATVDENLDYSSARKMELQGLAQVGNPLIDQIEILKFFITFFQTVALRAINRAQIPNFVKLIRKVLQKNVALCVWLVEAMSSQDMIKEFFIDCPIPDMSRFMAGLMKTAMSTLYHYEKDKI